MPPKCPSSQFYNAVLKQCVSLLARSEPDDITCAPGERNLLGTCVPGDWGHIGNPGFHDKE
jgi:hypothetical protein